MKIMKDVESGYTRRQTLINNSTKKLYHYELCFDHVVDFQFMIKHRTDSQTKKFGIKGCHFPEDLQTLQLCEVHGCTIV